jgi:hypothetical protein
VGVSFLASSFLALLGGGGGGPRLAEDEDVVSLVSGSDGERVSSNHGPNGHCLHLEMISIIRASNYNICNWAFPFENHIPYVDELDQIFHRGSVNVMGISQLGNSIGNPYTPVKTIQIETFTDWVYGFPMELPKWRINPFEMHTPPVEEFDVNSSQGVSV